VSERLPSHSSKVVAVALLSDCFLCFSCCIGLQDAVPSESDGYSCDDVQWMMHAEPADDDRYQSKLHPSVLGGWQQGRCYSSVRRGERAARVGEACRDGGPWHEGDCLDEERHGGRERRCAERTYPRLPAPGMLQDHEAYGEVDSIADGMQRSRQGWMGCERAGDGIVEREECCCRGSEQPC